MAPGPVVKTILLADDDCEHISLLHATLADPAYRILTADNGVDALAMAIREQPDVVVLDYHMPGLSGFDVATHLRENPVTAAIPFIMLTGVSDEKEQQRLLELGARSYLVKPFSPLHLLGEIRGILGSTEPPQEENASDAPSAEVREELATGRSQLALYARDLKRVVDEERRRSRELADANERLARLDRLKTDFLSFVSHELRTPLQVMSVIELADTGMEPQRLAMQLEMFRLGYDRLRQFVERGLKYFGWLSRDGTEPRGTADVALVLGTLAESMLELSEPDVTFSLRMPEVGCLVRGEARHLGDVFEILLENALKFSSSPKTVLVEGHVLPRRVIISVSDQGAGFPPEMASEILRPFTVVDVEHHTRGTGLSLALAAAIVRAYGGTLEARSEGRGRGATFHVHLRRVDPDCGA